MQCEGGGGSNISVVCEIASCEECVERQNKELYGGRLQRVLQVKERLGDAQREVKLSR